MNDYVVLAQIVPVGTRVITEDDLDEWEECSVGDPDCEEVEIIEGDDDEEDDEDEVSAILVAVDSATPVICDLCCMCGLDVVICWDY